MTGKKFDLGQVVVTKGIDEKMKEDRSFQVFVQVSIGRYVHRDWGQTCDEDAKANNRAIQNDERILAVYKQPKTDTTIWIITESDRSVTTILFPDEY